MNTLRRFIASHPELAILAVIATMAVILFDSVPTDLLLSAFFFDSRSTTWPASDIDWVRFLNLHFMEGFSAAAAVVSLVCIAISLRHRQKNEWRRVGVFLLLSLAVGPGLLVNGVFKSQWGRARPEHVVQFGGTEQFRRPFEPGKGGAPELGGAGRSFPSGHAAVAFWSSSAFFVARYLLPAQAGLILAGSIALGSVVGLARVAAGRHFVSDILWAGILVFGVNWLIAYRVMALPRQPTPPSTAQ